jgi:hypothetical protein
LVAQELLLFIDPLRPSLETDLIDIISLPFPRIDQGYLSLIPPLAVFVYQFYSLYHRGSLVGETFSYNSLFSVPPQHKRSKVPIQEAAPFATYLHPPSAMPSSAPVLRPKKAQPVTAPKDKQPINYDINIPYVDVTKDNHLRTRYPAYLPTWDKLWFDPLPPFEYDDPALRVKDKSKPNLLTSNAEVTQIQPQMGSVIEGVQLSQLSAAAKDELALLVSERKVVAFPNQDLIDAGPAAQAEFMGYFGKPNYQPVSGTVRGYPGFHIIHRDGNKEEISRFLEQRTTTTLWHQDVSYEIQPPGYVMLGLLEGPDVGGDTVFAATDMAYK